MRILLIFTGKSTKPKKKQIHRPWSVGEVRAVLGAFEPLMRKGKLPGKAAIEKLKEENKKVLSQRTWKDIKYYCKYYKDKLKSSQ